MGSYLTVVNNTPDNWQCKVGPDMRALKIASIVAAVIGGIAAIITTAGAAAPFVTAIAAAGIVTVYGVSTAALVAITGAVAGTVAITAGVIGGATGFSIAIAKALGSHLNDQGYDMILAGESKRYGKMTLSLWQQSACIKRTVYGPKVEVDTLYMRPIFSGATANSNRNHDIQYWINKHGTSKETIQGSSETMNQPYTTKEPIKDTNETTKEKIDGRNETMIQQSRTLEANEYIIYGTTEN